MTVSFFTLFQKIFVLNSSYIWLYNLKRNHPKVDKILKKVTKSYIYFVFSRKYLITVWKCESISHSVVSSFLQPHGWWTARLLCPWNSPGKNIGVHCHFLLQRVFLTQGSNPGLLHFWQTSYSLSHQGICISITSLYTMNF